MYQQKWKDNLARFSIEFGPASLFERINYIMKDVHSLHIKGPHFQKRLAERCIPPEVIQAIANFNVQDWQVVTAEVRPDRGKFYNSTWEYTFKGKKYWLTIGLHNAAETIVVKNSSGITKCIRSGELYDFVNKANKELMKADEKSSSII